MLWRQFERRTERTERRKRRCEREQRRGQQQQQREQEQELEQEQEQHRQQAPPQQQEQQQERATCERTACESAADLRGGQIAVNEDLADLGRVGLEGGGGAVGQRGDSHQATAWEGHLLPGTGQGTGLGLSGGRQEHGVQQAAAAGVGCSAVTCGSALTSLTEGRSTGGAHPAPSTGCAGGGGGKGGVQAGEQGSGAEARTEEQGGLPGVKGWAGGGREGRGSRVGCAGGSRVAGDAEKGGGADGDGRGDGDKEEEEEVGDKGAGSDSDSDLDVCVEPVDFDSQSWRSACWEAAQQLLRVGSGSGAVLLPACLEIVSLSLALVHTQTFWY